MNIFPSSHSENAETVEFAEPIGGGPQLKQRDYRLPLAIAVTGHRDLIEEDKDRLRAQVGKIFDDLEKYYPDSKPFQLLSGLAEGSDRLVANVALEREAQLMACLPMARHLYKEDFQTETSRREFVELLDRATAIHERPFVPGNTPENIHREECRNLQYDSLGRYLVGKCHVLIALWDGVETGLIGGTSTVVSLQLYGLWGKNGVDSENPLPFPITGPVFHILTPRQKNPAPVGNLQDRQLLFAAGFEIAEKIKRNYDKIFFRRANLFNRDSSTLRRRNRPAIDRSKDWLLPKQDRHRLNGGMRQLIHHYATADCLALSYRARTRWAFRVLIFFLGLVGVLSFELFAHAPIVIQPVMLTAYLGIIAVAVVFYRYEKFRDVKTRHLDYRALAEGLRLQIFWKLAGITESVADHYLTKQRTELDWVRDAIRRWNATVTPLRVPDWQLVGTHWIRNQFDFFTKAESDNERARRWEHRFYWFLVVLVFVIGITIIVAHAINPQLREDFHDDWLSGFKRHDLLAIIMTLLPAIAGTISAYSIKMAFSEQRRQYQRMKELYRRGLFCFEKAMQMESDEPGLRQLVVFQLGQEALSENADWVLMHRERLVEIFVGG